MSFLQLAAHPIVQTNMQVCATSGVGMATKISAAVFVTRAGAPMGEEEGPYLNNTARPISLTNRMDFAIRIAAQIT